MTGPDPAAGQGVPELPPILYWSPSLAVGDGLDWEPGVAPGVIEETDAGTLFASHEGGWAILRELPADAGRLVVDAAPARSGAEPGDDTAAAGAGVRVEAEWFVADRARAEVLAESLMLLGAEASRSTPAVPAGQPATLNSELTVPVAASSSVPRAPVEALLAALDELWCTYAVDDRLWPDAAVAEVRRHLDTTTHQPEEGRQ